jgi:hypothetical protein
MRAFSFPLMFYQYFALAWPFSVVAQFLVLLVASLLACFPETEHTDLPHHRSS